MTGRPLRLAMVAGAAALAAGCAGGGRPGGPGGGPHVRPENAFISPSGEPFHAPRDAPYASAVWFARADADGDGRLTRAEFMADAERAFHRYDTDGNGVLDGLEIQAYEDRIAPEILPRVGQLHAGEGMDESLFGGRRGGGGRRGREGEGGRSRSRPQAADVEMQGAAFYGFLDEPEPLSAADADLDGKVTLAEWRARSERRFDLLANGASALTLAALPKTGMQRVLERQAVRDASGRRNDGGRLRPAASPDGPPGDGH